MKKEKPINPEGARDKIMTDYRAAYAAANNGETVEIKYSQEYGGFMLWNRHPVRDAADILRMTENLKARASGTESADTKRAAAQVVERSLTVSQRILMRLIRNGWKFQPRSAADKAGECHTLTLPGDAIAAKHIHYRVVEKLEEAGLILEGVFTEGGQRVADEITINLCSNCHAYLAADADKCHFCEGLKS